MNIQILSGLLYCNFLLVNDSIISLYDTETELIIDIKKEV